MALPLEGIRAVEMCQVYAGPYVAIIHQPAKLSQACQCRQLLGKSSLDSNLNLRFTDATTTTCEHQHECWQ